MLSKTLGGDRIGSGNRMKVPLHSYERSTHNLGYLWRSTMAAGTIVPFMVKVALPGDTWDINLDADVKTHPTVGPLFGSFKFQAEVYQAPIRLYNGLLHNNALGIGKNISQVKFPQIRLTPTIIDLDKPGLDIDNCQINPSSLLAYIGIRGVGNPGDLTTTRDFNALAIVMYWDIVKNYHVNKQEEIGAVIHTPAEALGTTPDFVQVINAGPPTDIPQYPVTGSVQLNSSSQIRALYTAPDPPPIPQQIIINLGGFGNVSMYDLCNGNIFDFGTHIQGNYDFAQYGITDASSWRMQEPNDTNIGKPAIVTFPLSNLDDMRNALTQNMSTSAPYLINTLDKAPYKYLYEQPFGIPNVLSSQEGLALKCYLSDMFNNWLNSDWINDITTATSIDTSGGSFTMDQFILTEKLFQLQNRIAVAGGSYDDWQDAVWAHARYKRCETPMYVGGLIKEVVFQEVVSNSEASGGEGSQPLGTLAGRGVMSRTHKGGNITVKIDEPSYIMGLINLTPRIDYSQGNVWDVHLKTLDDLHKPQLDQIGFQDDIVEERAWWDTKWDGTKWIQTSAGKQPAWLKYMTEVNRTYGNFAIASNEMFMTLNRRYEPEEITANVKDLTTYIDPSKFNFIFAQTALDAQNFWVQMAVNIIVRRKMSAKVMPNL